MKSAEFRAASAAQGGDHRGAFGVVADSTNWIRSGSISIAVTTLDNSAGSSGVEDSIRVVRQVTQHDPHPGDLLSDLQIHRLTGISACTGVRSGSVTADR